MVRCVEGGGIDVPPEAPQRGKQVNACEPVAAHRTAAAETLVLQGFRMVEVVRGVVEARTGGRLVVGECAALDDVVVVDVRPEKSWSATPAISAIVSTGLRI